MRRDRQGVRRRTSRDYKERSMRRDRQGVRRLTSRDWKEQLRDVFNKM
jgi:hypothetical protein